MTSPIQAAIERIGEFDLEFSPNTEFAQYVGALHVFAGEVLKRYDAGGFMARSAEDHAIMVALAEAITHRDPT